jgi:hypothetical protein
MRTLIVSTLAALTFVTGCASYVAAVPSNQGKAYVVVAGLFSQKMYHCDATGGKPVCKEQTEQ